jgi:hypothetical protein
MFGPRHRPAHRTIGQLKQQNHTTGHLVLILTLTGVGLVVLLFFAFVVGRLNDFDNQDTPPVRQTPQQSPQQAPQQSP